MLRKLIVRNMKSFESLQDAPLSKITLIYGPNSAGKSSLIQSLLLLKQTLDDPDPLRSSLIARGPLVDLGSFTALIHGHDTSKPLMIGLQYNLVMRAERRVLGLRLPSKELRNVEFTFEWHKASEATRQQSVKVQAGEHINFKFSRQMRKRSYTRDNPLVLNQRDTFEFADEDSRMQWTTWLKGEFARIKSQPYTARLGERKAESEGEISYESTANIRFGARGFLPGPVYRWTGKVEESVRGSREEFFFWDQFTSGWSSELSALMQSIVYLGPLRRPPERFEIFSGTTRTNVGRTGEFTTEILASSRNGGEILREVNEWLGKLQIPYTVDIRNIGNESIGDAVSLVLRDERRKLLVSPTDVGFGISQLLPIVVQCLASRNTLICIEQPEIHAHPRLQAVMADLLIAACEPPYSNQIIAETHSEHLILRLQRRIREGSLPSADVSVLYVEPEEDGSSVVKVLRLDDDGEFLDEWPSGFFEERLSEI